jgi:hypothetical protein
MLLRNVVAFMQRVEDNTFRLAAQLHPNLESWCDLPRVPAAFASQGAALG